MKLRLSADRTWRAIRPASSESVMVRWWKLVGLLVAGTAPSATVWVPALWWMAMLRLPETTSWEVRDDRSGKPAPKDCRDRTTLSRPRTVVPLDAGVIEASGA